jgi:hypothetical protein
MHREHSANSFRICEAGVAFMLAATPAELLQRHQQASDVTERTCGATSHYTTSLLQSHCATCGGNVTCCSSRACRDRALILSL